MRAIAAALIVLCLAGRAPASGWFLPAARFWSSSKPSEPLDRYLDGHLGILAATYERSLPVRRLSPPERPRPGRREPRRRGGVLREDLGPRRSL